MRFPFWVIDLHGNAASCLLWNEAINYKLPAVARGFSMALLVLIAATVASALWFVAECAFPIKLGLVSLFESNGWRTPCWAHSMAVWPYWRTVQLTIRALSMVGTAAAIWSFERWEIWLGAYGTTFFVALVWLVVVIPFSKKQVSSASPGNGHFVIARTDNGEYRHWC